MTASGFSTRSRRPIVTTVARSQSAPAATDRAAKLPPAIRHVVPASGASMRTATPAKAR